MEFANKGAIKAAGTTLSIVSNFPTYLMTPFKMHVCNANKIDTLSKEFLRRSSNAQRRRHGVKWDHVCIPRVFVARVSENAVKPTRPTRKMELEVCH